MVNKKITPSLEQHRVVTQFNQAADSYDGAAVWQREIADRMLDRLELVRINPQVILDIGARTGYTTQLLTQRFPEAKIIACDWAENLLHKVGEQAPAALPLCAEPDRIPLAAQTADMIISNLTWHWLNQPAACLREWRRLLKPNGLLLFTTCGPDTLYELRSSFAAIDDQPHVHLFLDMHDIGDMLLAAQFADPVMQAEHIYFNYSSLDGLWRDLKATGVVNALRARRRSLTGKNRWRRMLAEYKKLSCPAEGWPATIEVVYGLGWVTGSPVSYSDEPGEVIVPIHQIGKKYEQNS
jgi:malonyl-CoA O-methyltransferase